MLVEPFVYLKTQSVIVKNQITEIPLPLHLLLFPGDMNCLLLKSYCESLWFKINQCTHDNRTQIIDISSYRRTTAFNSDLILWDIRFQIYPRHLSLSILNQMVQILCMPAIHGYLHSCSPSNAWIKIIFHSENETGQTRLSKTTK